MLDAHPQSEEKFWLFTPPSPTYLVSYMGVNGRHVLRRTVTEEGGRGCRTFAFGSGTSSLFVVHGVVPLAWFLHSCTAISSPLTPYCFGRGRYMFVTRPLTPTRDEGHRSVVLVIFWGREETCVIFGACSTGCLQPSTDSLTGRGACR